MYMSATVPLAQLACGFPYTVATAGIPTGTPYRNSLEKVTESDSLTGTGNPGYRKFAPLPYENHTFLRNVTKRKRGSHSPGKGTHPRGTLEIH